MPDVTITIRTIDESTKNTKKVSESFDKLKNSASGLVAAGVAVGKFLMDASNQASSAAKSQAKLEGVLRSTGEAAGLNATELNKMALEMEKVNAIDADLITNAQAVMLTFTKIGAEVFPQTIQAAMDMSAVLGGDLQGSVIQVGKAMNDFSGYTALKKAGVSFTAEQTKQIERFKETNNLVGYQNLVLNELAVEFGGVAQAMQEAGNGSAQMKIAWGNMMEAIGASPAATWIEDFNRGVQVTAQAIADTTNAARENKTEMELNKAAWAEHRKELGYSGKALLPIGEEFEKFAAAESNARVHAKALQDELNKITNGTAPALIASLDGMAGSLEEVSARNADLINDAISIQSSQDKYNESQQETLDKIAALQEEKAGMYAWEREDIAAVDEKIKELQGAYADASAEFVAAQQTKLAMMALEKVALSDGVAGYSEAEAEKAMAILATADIAEEAAIRQAIAFDTVSGSIANSANAAQDLERILKAMAHGYTIDVAMHMTTTGVASTGGQNVQQTQYAAGGSFIVPNAAGGSFNIPHANGQSFMLPASIGNEAFRMGGGHTATGGERVTVTPQNKDIIDYKKFARVLRDTIAQAG